MIERVVEAAESAGRVIQEVRSRDFDVTQKGSQGPVTEADHAADALLHETLLAIEPCAWLSEESTDDPSRLAAKRLWVVDPLDGTKEFIRGMPEYAVAVALVDSGRPVLGVVHNPATQETFWAEAGAGAYKNGTRIRVREANTLLASRSEIKRGEFAPLMDSWDVVPIGSIEYKLARIAAGDAAATLSRGPKWEWDVCAGALLIQEAGGTATDLFGGGYEFNQEFPKVKGVLAGAPEAYRRAEAQIAALGASDRMREFDS